MLCSKTSCQQPMKTLGFFHFRKWNCCNFTVNQLLFACEKILWGLWERFMNISLCKPVCNVFFFFLILQIFQTDILIWQKFVCSCEPFYHLSIAKLSLCGFTIFSLYIPLDRTWSLCRTYLGWSCPSLEIGHWVPEPWCLVHHELRALCTSYQHLLNDVKWLNEQFRFTVFFEKLHIIYNSLPKV